MSHSVLLQSNSRRLENSEPSYASSWFVCELCVSKPASLGCLHEEQGHAIKAHAEHTMDPVAYLESKKWSVI